VINLKGNQETLQQEVQKYYEHLEETGELKRIKIQSLQQNTGDAKKHKGIGFQQTLDNGHGRIEKRTYFYSTDIAWMIDAKRDWEKLTGIGSVIREVEYTAEANRKTIETAYYVGSVDNVIDFARATRTHWGVESMHWSLDVTFRDDRNQTRGKVAAQNLATVKRMVFNTLKNENAVYPNKSKPKKRIAAATDPEYRDRLMNLNFQER
jgi:predicted transposase YbfD/YdcC